MSSIRKMIDGSVLVRMLTLDWENHCTLRPTTSSTAEIIRKQNVLINQASQCSQPGRPIIFIASVSWRSFSSVMARTVFTHVYTNDSMMTMLMKADKPKASGSRMYGGCGCLWRDIRGREDELKATPRSWLMTAYVSQCCTARKRSKWYPGGYPPSSTPGCRTPPMKKIGNRRPVRQSDGSKLIFANRLSAGNLNKSSTNIIRKWSSYNCLAVSRRILDLVKLKPTTEKEKLSCKLMMFLLNYKFRLLSDYCT